MPQTLIVKHASPATHLRHWGASSLIKSESAKLRSVVRNFTLDQPHPLAETAAEAAFGLDAVVFMGCIDRGKYTDAVNADRGDGETLGVRGAPTLLIGTVDPDNRGRVRALRTIMGNLPLCDFQKAIDEILAESNRNAEPRP